MGISSSKQTNKPVYNKQIEGAGGSLTSAYDQTMPKIQGMSDTLAGLMPGLVQKYNEGDAGVNAARNYNVDTLSGRYLDQGNPHLQSMIDQSGDDTRNQAQAALGARGLTGGSSYADIISRNVGKNSLAMRYQDYDQERARMATAAGQSPGLAAADQIPIASMLGIADTASDPLQAAVGYAGGLGGLLGQYQKVKSKQAWGPIAAQALSNMAAAFAGGG